MNPFPVLLKGVTAVYVMKISILVTILKEGPEKTIRNILCVFFFVLRIT